MPRHLATRWTGGGVGAFRVGSEARAAERVETRQGLGVGECLAADRTLGQVAQKTPETVVAVSVRHHQAQLYICIETTVSCRRLTHATKSCCGQSNTHNHLTALFPGLPG